MRREGMTSEGETNAVVGCVRAMLEKTGIAKDQQTQLVAQILELGQSQAWRKLNGKSPLTVPELAQLAHHRGWSLGRLLLPLTVLDSVPSQEVLATLLQRHAEEAVLLVDGLSVACCVTLGDTASADSVCSFVAIGAPGKWVILPRERVTTPGREVLRLVVQETRLTPSP